MTKTRKISKGDIVTYHSYEWVVKRKRNGMVNLIRRQVNTGPPIWVPDVRLKHADTSWRTNLRANDPVLLFLGGHWLKSRVLRREGNIVCIQPIARIALKEVVKISKSDEKCRVFKKIGFYLAN